MALSVMISPEKAASQALKMMFRGRSGRIPGLLNKIFIPLLIIIPNRLISMIEKKVTKKWDLK
jgi:short-subunit dehydrogenase